jgi:protein disulfide-isomerase
MGLEQFPHRDRVEVSWHSFELDPGMKTQPGVNVLDYLARIKGITREQATQMHAHVKQVGEEVGLGFDFDRSVLANSFNGHRLIQLAKARGFADRAEEELFKAHFTEGKNIDDQPTLTNIGVVIGIPETELQRVFASDEYAEEVRQDIATAKAVGIRGVPFFIFNSKFAISGAQAPEFFLQTLSKAWNEFTSAKTLTSL